MNKLVKVIVLAAALAAPLAVSTSAVQAQTTNGTHRHGMHHYKHGMHHHHYKNKNHS